MTSGIEQAVQREKALKKRIEELLEEGQSIDVIAKQLAAPITLVQAIARRLKRM